jgi:hypothetical protein
MKNSRVLVYTTNKLFEAELMQQYLANQGVIAFVLNKMDSAYHFGEIEILVEPDDVIKSKKLIEEFSKNE